MSRHLLWIFCLVAAATFTTVLAQVDEEEDEDLDEDVAQFYEWMEKHHVFTQFTEIKTIPGYGRGVVATEDIKKGDKIMEVPFTAMLIPQTLATSSIGSLLEKYGFSPTHEVAVFLVHERYNPDSPWAPYIKLLPESFDTTLYWSEEELHELQASSLREFTQRRTQSITNNFDRIFTETLFINESDHFDPNKITWADFAWALSVIWSRAFSLQVNGRESGGLVPMADMYNAALDADSANVRAEITDTSLVYYASRDVPRRAQLFVTYGKQKKLGNAQLLMDYGFWFPNNPNDLVMLDIPLTTPADPLYSLKQSILQERGLWSPQFPIYRDQLPMELLSALRIILLTEEERHLWSRAFETDVVVETPQNLDDYNGPIPYMISLRNERAVIRTVIQLCNRLLDKYPTTMEEDEALLMDISINDPWPLTRNSLGAVVVRWAEKRILRYLISSLEYIRDNKLNAMAQRVKEKARAETLPQAYTDTPVRKQEPEMFQSEQNNKPVVSDKEEMALPKKGKNKKKRKIR